MSAFCERQKFTGAARWLRLQSQEEYMHAMKLFDFMLARDCERGAAGDRGVRASPFNTVAVDVFERRPRAGAGSQPSDRLRCTRPPSREKAFAAVAELQWFLTEQVEEEKTGREIVAKIQDGRQRPGVAPRPRP